MHSFDVERPTMPSGFEDYMEVVLDLVSGAGLYKGRVHMTVDEKLVKAGMSHRKPDPHVDGCFRPDQMDWGHGGSGGWLHGCNNVSTGEPYRRMPVIVAASVAGCKAFRGDFDGQPGPDGDLSHIGAVIGAGEALEANYGWLLSPDCVHESMVMPVDTQRTFLRIALPVDFRF